MPRTSGFAVARLSIQHTERQQFLPQFETTSIIHPENLYCRPVRRRSIPDMRAVEGKMIGPAVATRMKQWNYFTRNWIDPCQIGPL
jgi:hypothetical protein